MAAILAKKLGMTQVFTDDGRVERVTVLEAGPCPVTAIRSRDRDGYEAVQLAFGATREKHLTTPDLGHLEGQGLPGHGQAPSVRPRARHPRLAQRPRARLDRRRRVPRARLQGP